MLFRWERIGIVTFWQIHNVNVNTHYFTHTSIIEPHRKGPANETDDDP